MPSNLFDSVHNSYVNKEAIVKKGDFDAYIVSNSSKGFVKIYVGRGSQFGDIYEVCQRNKLFYEAQGFHANHSSKKITSFNFGEQMFDHFLSISWEKNVAQPSKKATPEVAVSKKNKKHSHKK